MKETTVIMYETFDGNIYDTFEKARKHEEENRLLKSEYLKKRFESMTRCFDVPFSEWSGANNLYVVMLKDKDDYDTMIQYLEYERNNCIYNETTCPTEYPCMKILSVQEDVCSFPHIKEWCNPYELANEIYKSATELLRKANELKESK